MGLSFTDDDLEKLEKAEERVVSEETKLPTGYIPIYLSTRGRLGVPEVIHVRNFNTEDMFDLSMAVQEILPTKTIQALNRIIYEKDVDVADWPEKAVIELLIKVYSNFFTPFLSSVPFPWNDEDVQFLKDNDKEAQLKDLKSGTWIPKVDLDLATFSFVKLDPKIKDVLTVKKKDNSFSFKISACPKIGDVLKLRKFVDNVFSETDKKWDLFKQSLELRERYISEGRLDKILPVDSKTYEKYLEYEASKASTLLYATQALYLLEYNGEDVRNKSLTEKIKLIQDPRFDISVTKKLEKQFNSLEFGIQNEIEVMNPITNKPCKRRFLFRILDILQAIRLYDSSDYDFSYDD